MTRYSISFARKIFKERFEEDEGFRFGYQSAIAVFLYDRYGISNHEERNKDANDIMKVIFDAIPPIREKNSNKDFIESRFDILDFREE